MTQDVATIKWHEVPRDHGIKQHESADGRFQVVNPANWLAPRNQWRLFAARPGKRSAQGDFLMSFRGRFATKAEAQAEAERIQNEEMWEA